MAKRTDIKSLEDSKRGRPFCTHDTSGSTAESGNSRPGVDYDCTRDQSRSRANSAARSQGGKIVTRAVPGSLTKLLIQFTKVRP